MYLCSEDDHMICRNMWPHFMIKCNVMCLWHIYCFVTCTDTMGRTKLRIKELTFNVLPKLKYFVHWLGHNNSTALFTCRSQKYKHILSANTLITGYFTSTLSTFGFKILLTWLYFRKVSNEKRLLGIFVLHYYRFQQCERTDVCKVYIYYFIWGVNSSCSIK
jgi:hypothetical protein